MLYESHSYEETLRLAGVCAETAAPGDVYCLTGELGAGKTAFAQGFALGLGVGKPVSSPTFTLLHEYTDGRLPLYHFDVYRVTADETPAAEPPEDIGYEDYFYGGGVCLLEWGERLGPLLPARCTVVKIMKVPHGENRRRIEIGESPCAS